MWVDVFGKNQNVPPPVDIVPRQAEPFVLRIVVWNVEGVPLKDDSIFGDEMSDIFVKGLAIVSLYTLHFFLLMNNAK